MTSTKFLIVNSAFKHLLRQDGRINSINDVIKGLGYTKGAFFHYFKNKEDFYCHLANQVSTSAIREYEKVLRKNRKDMRGLIDDLCNLIKSKNQSEMSRLSYAYKLRMDCPASKGICKSIDEFENAFISLTNEYLETQRSRGSLESGIDTEGLALSMLLILKGVFNSNIEGLDAKIDSSFRFLKATTRGH